MSLKGIPPLKKESAVAVLDEPTTTQEVQAVVGPTPALTNEQLLLLIAQMSASMAAQTQLLEKLSNPQEPKKSKEQIAREENERMFDERAKELRKRQKETARAEQDECVHIAGCSPLSEQKDIAGRTAIIWHRNDVGVDLGICTVCQRFFHPSDPPDAQGHTYSFWRKQPSFNKISAAGYRTVLDPVRAREESYLHDS